MPGTGHSARYKGSISNRVRISPFQRLAEWNAQLLGADGAVPSITGGGGSLAFKKLDASDIEGVLHNPTKVNLQFIAPAGIQSINGGAFKISADGILTLNGALGTIIGVSGGEVGMYGIGPVSQATQAIVTAVVSGGAGTPIGEATLFHGNNTGVERYTIGKVIQALIDFGILKN